MRYTPFTMERWQSTYEHRVGLNLSESGVHPMTSDELLELAGVEEGLGSLLLEYGQSNGSDELRAHIAALYAGATPDSVLVTVGGAEANFTAFWHLLERGCSAAVMLPTYGQVPGLLETFGATPVPFHLRWDEGGWAPDLDALAAALDRGARFILVTNPNNPTGAVLSEEAMDGIVTLARNAEAWLLCDEVYQGAELSGPPTASFWGRYERVLVTNSLSKAYGLPGLRIGWIVAPAPLIEDLWGRTDYTTITPATLSDALATIALEAGTRARILERTRSILTRNLGITRDWLDSHADLFEYEAPDAGAIFWLKYRSDVNSTEFAERLRAEYDVLVVPGDHFGVDGYLRIGFGPPEDVLMEGLNRLAAAFERAG